MKVRLNKFLSKAGVTSRREADRMIEEGRISVNGEVIQTLGHKIDVEKDRVEVDGKRVKIEEGKLYVMLNKPPGYLVSLKDPFNRPLVMDLLPSLKRRVFPVGRLDFESEGLLLLTNDGELAHRLAHPRYKVEKGYIVKVKGKLDASKLERLEKGVYLDRRRTAPAKAKLLSATAKTSLVRVDIHEGRKREVRRMFEVLGNRVVELQRTKLGGLSLGQLKSGKWRYLTRKEIARLKDQVGLN